MGSVFCKIEGEAGRSPARPPLFPFDEKELFEATAAPAEFTSDTLVEYVTDVEGHWEYFLRFVKTSQILYWKGEELGAWGEGILSLKPHGMLVFGGDAPDKGPGDIRIIRTLATLKKRYPTQVYLVLGNRDLMKLRFYAELQAVEDDDKIWMPTWDKNAKSFAAYRADMASKDPPISIQRDMIGKLKWLLHCTMGCQDTTFSTRKSELALLQNGARDQDVLHSYFDSVDPNGQDPWMLEYLELAQIGVVLGDTLFVHGGVREESIGYVPGREGTCSNVKEWVQALNDWKCAELAAFRQKPHFYEEGGVLTRGGAKLIEYGTPGAKDKTVIYYNPFKDGNPELRSPKVEEYLKASDIKRVLSGHQPHGQSPTVVRHPNTGLLVITADTSRSDGSACKLINPADNRGIAMSVVRLKGSKVMIEGKLVDGRSHRCEIDTDPTQDQLPNALVGRQLEDGAWVKTVVTDAGGEHLHCALGKGFNVKVNDLDTHSACLQLQKEFKDRGIFEVSLADYRSTMLPSHSMEDCRDADLTSYHKTADRNFELDRDAFLSADTYIFSIMGVILPPSSKKAAAGTEARSSELSDQIVAKINNLIERGKRIIFLTNNSNKTRHGLVDELRSTFGIDLSPASIPTNLSLRSIEAEPQRTSSGKHMAMPADVVTSAHTCGWFLRQKRIKKPFVICSELALLDELVFFGITNYVATIDKKGDTKPEYMEKITADRILALVRKAPDIDAIVVGWDQQFSALKIAVAAQYLRWAEESKRRIPVISCSMDASGYLGQTPPDYFPDHGFDDKKIFAVGNGAFTQSILCVNGSEEVINVGKPSRLLLEQLKQPLEKGGLGVDFSKTVVVGSTLNTDIELANGASMKSLLVLTGVTTKEEAMKEKNPLRIPTWIAKSFADI
eukprot:TRINITY_DN2211_c0_g3_i1.p1 TRINITY_DN2211_c0_g3~~TRINITY_DN2211_c0_g3_i1.p1  ORF type:complete len:899 (-),score=161.31 TRINITY_DN2211_c0_g3_i1:69-2765(-)